MKINYEFVDTEARIDEEEKNKDIAARNQLEDLTDGDEADNTMDRESVGEVPNHSAQKRVEQPPTGKFKDDGPKMARNMGFPNMKYLDPESHGPPII